jgi:hypothetical protein
MEQTHMKAIDIIDMVPPWQRACLVTDPFFDDIAVVVFEEGNIGDAIARAQSVITETEGKRGVAVIVPQVTADDYSNNLQFGPMAYKLSFIVIENVEMNNDAAGTHKSARKVARKIRDVMKCQNYQGVIANLTTAKPCIEPIAVKDVDEKFVMYGVNFECLEVSQEAMTALQPPIVSSNGAAFALASSTPNSEVWFTLDDTFPYNGTADDYPGDPNLNLAPSTAIRFVPGVYVPIPSNGATIQARAYPLNPGDSYIASGITRCYLRPPIS